ncbi:MAG: hypothetical protein CK427_15975 [Leptospira sp.]|jgi:hypothetical protein|nr:MAG: hypothetical protein CK427_15975 [Leptospira sp.]
MTAQVNFEIEEEPPGARRKSSLAEGLFQTITPTNHHQTIQKLSVTLLRDTFVGTDNTGLSGSFAHSYVRAKTSFSSQRSISTISPWAGKNKPKLLLEGGFSI